jgi:PAS domain-containing protein
MRDATLVLGADGSYVDASPSALALLGVTLEELRALPPGSLSAERPDEAQREAIQEAFQAAGATGAVGAGTLRRPDGKKVRVRFLIDRQADGGYVARLKPAPEPVDRPTVFVTLGKVLAAWRAADRRLQTLDPDSNEAKAAQAQIDLFRDEYRRLTDRRSGRGH